MTPPPSPASLPPVDHAARRERLHARLADTEVAALLVTAPANVRYLTGFTGSNGQLLVTPGDVVLVTDGRYEERARTEAPDATLVLDRDWRGRTTGLLRDAGLDRVGFEAGHLSYAAARGLIAAAEERGVTAVPVEGSVEALRETKDAHELAALDVACALTTAALEHLLAELAPGRTERDLARTIERTMEDLGAEAPAFASIVAGGPHSAVPHHQPTDRPVRRGELVKLDVGARYAGYHADLTRTVSLGEPDDRGLVAVHDLVRAAQQAGVDAATAGTTAGEVDDACRAPLTAAGHGDRFVHGTGHGVGLQIHEPPWVSPGGSGRLRPGTVITVEPGVYLPGRGGVRIEDTVAVTADGSPRRLTTSPRDLLRL